MRCAFILPMQGRHSLTFRTVRYLAGLAERSVAVNEVLVSVCGSEGETSRDVVVRAGGVYTELSNDDLWKKWQGALDTAGSTYDFYIVMGSDNLVTPAYLDVAALYVRMGMWLVQPRAISIYDAVARRLAFLPDHYDGAVGRVIASPLYHRLEGQCFQQNVVTAVDQAQMALLEKNTHPTLRGSMPITLSTPWQILDIKTEESRWTWDRFDPAVNPTTRPVNPQIYLETMWPDFEFTGL